MLKSILLYVSAGVAAGLLEASRLHGLSRNELIGKILKDRLDKSN